MKRVKSEGKILNTRPEPDSGVWINRTAIDSDSGHTYIVSQHRDLRHWACSCRGYTMHADKRNCKHLKLLGVPGGQLPFEGGMLEQLDTNSVDFGSLLGE